MKAISLWQPWASAIALGAKQIETRSWSTAYRGPLAIHAAKRKVTIELLHLGCLWGWRAAMDLTNDGSLLDLPFGAIVAMCDLVDCRPTGSFTVDEVRAVRRRPAQPVGWTENEMGDFSPGRFGWVLADVRALSEPIPLRGAQGLFDVAPAIALAIAHATGSTFRRCRICGCTDDDCRQCSERTGEPCHWVEEDLCSACAVEMP